MVGVTNKLPGVVYPDPERLENYISNGVLKETPLASAFIEALPKHGDKVAITSDDGDISYAELDDQSNRFAASLLDLGLNPLDRVMFQLANSKAVFVAVLACWKANLIPVCTLAAHRKSEIGYLAKHASARAHFIEIADNFDYPNFAEEIRSEIPSMEYTIVVRGQAQNGALHMDELIKSQDPFAARDIVRSLERDPYQVTVFQLSGGTTSIPKIIPRFSNEYLYNFEGVAKALDYRSDDTVFMPLQFIHNGGMLYNFPALLKGARIAVAADISPPSLLNVLMNAKPTKFALMAAAVARMKAFNITSIVDFSHVRLVISPNVGEQVEETLNVPSVQLFGMTEGLITFGHPEDPAHARHNTVGTPISSSDQIKIVRPGTEEELPHGEIGEMLSRGPYTVSGYYDAPDRDAEAFTADGFYRSGDLMSIRVIEGKEYLAYEGRLKDLISRGGEKINCEEVELASRKHPGIADIMIVAMPDPEMDERACAFIIPAGPDTAPDPKSLMEFLTSAGLAKFKCPERIELIEEFPQTESGKPSKPKLKAMIAETLKQERASVLA